MELGVWNTKQESTVSEILLKGKKERKTKMKSTMNMHKGHINGMSDNFRQFSFGAL